MPNINVDYTMQAHVDQHLTIASAKFVIIPNCGKGDCLFKTISQALHSGDAQSHYEVRRAIVDYVVARKWDYLKGSIEVQHVQQNEHLQEAWTEDPVTAYKQYMSSPGALGSMSELTAAAGLFKFNFVTIQEYDLTEGISYRVENCTILNDSHIPRYYFFFTGDFDNGHWEYLHPIGVQGQEDYLLSDGIHCGTITTVINGEECSFDNWLKIHTENTNSPFDLKCDAFFRIPAAAISQSPFDSNVQFETDGSILLDGERFRIDEMKYADLFSVITSILFKGCDDEGTISQLEAELLDHRIENFSDLNDKLIRQPHSHGFNLANLKYVSMPSKGNVQDLLTVACLRGFSFRIFIQPSRSKLRSCTFIHPDRWGGKSDKMLHFFMKLVNCPKTEEIVAKWWHLLPSKEGTGKDLNDNLCSGDSSSDIADVNAGNKGPNSQQLNCLMRKPKDASTKNSSQQTVQTTENDKDNLTVKLENLPESQKHSGLSAMRSQEVQIVTQMSKSETKILTAVETSNDESNESTNTKIYQCQSGEKYASKEKASESFLDQDRTEETFGTRFGKRAGEPVSLPGIMERDTNNNTVKQEDLPVNISVRVKESQKFESPGSTTVTSQESMLSSRHSFHLQQRRQKGYAETRNIPTKKSPWKTFFQKCLPCAKFD